MGGSGEYVLHNDIKTRNGINPGYSYTERRGL
jgi:hypothetical protein